MHILVTGVAGAIGSHVAEALVKNGHYVRGIDSLSPYYSRSLKDINVEDIKKAGVEFAEVNLATDTLDGYLKDIEVIYHFAAQPGISDTTSFTDYVTNNITATYNLLEAVRRIGGVKLFVQISTSSVYGKRAAGDETTNPKPASIYGVTKLAAEQLALAYHQQYGIPVTVVRLFSVYGERERPEKLYHKFIRSILNAEPFNLYEGAKNHVRSYTYVGDIVEGCLLVLAHRDRVAGEIFNLGTDTTITTGEGMAIVESILGKSAIINHVPERPGDQLETAANINKAREVLEYDPKIAPLEGLAREVAWYKAKVHNKL
jgi:UDP-glucuronate 4-epimerase